MIIHKKGKYSPLGNDCLQVTKSSNLFVGRNVSRVEMLEEFSQYFLVDPFIIPEVE